MTAGFWCSIAVIEFVVVLALAAREGWLREELRMALVWRAKWEKIAMQYARKDCGEPTAAQVQEAAERARQAATILTPKQADLNGVPMEHWSTVCDEKEVRHEARVNGWPKGYQQHQGSDQ